MRIYKVIVEERRSNTQCDVFASLADAESCAAQAVSGDLNSWAEKLGPSWKWVSNRSIERMGSEPDRGIGIAGQIGLSECMKHSAKPPWLWYCKVSDDGPTAWIVAQDLEVTDGQ